MSPVGGDFSYRLEREGARDSRAFEFAACPICQRSAAAPWLLRDHEWRQVAFRLAAVVREQGAHTLRAGGQAAPAESRKHFENQARLLEQS